MSRMLWKGPSVVEIARLAGVSTATVDRVINARDGVREVTRQKVEKAINHLAGSMKPCSTSENKFRIAFICEAGSSFIGLIESQAKKYIQLEKKFNFVFDSIPNVQVDPDRFSKLIARRSKECDGMIVVARDNLKVNRAVREATEAGVKVICLTTDLPNSGRMAYVGVDQVSTGATAGWLMGRMLPKQKGEILLLYSSTYRTQVEREVGFRRVLNEEFPNLSITERLSTKDEPESTYPNIMKYLNNHRSLAGIYNMAGGNRGIAKALKETNLTKQVIFIGHELSEHTRLLLENGEMDIVLGHDIEREIEICLRLFDQIAAGDWVKDSFTSLLVYNRHSYFI